MINAMLPADGGQEAEARPATRTIQIRNFPEQEYQELRREILTRRANGETLTVADVVVAALTERRRRGGRTK